MDMPDNIYLVHHVDDVTAAITVRYMEETQRKLSQVIMKSTAWLNSHSCKLKQKAELILLTEKHTAL